MQEIKDFAEISHSLLLTVYLSNDPSDRTYALNPFCLPSFEETNNFLEEDKVVGGEDIIIINSGLSLSLTKGYNNVPKESETMNKEMLDEGKGEAKVKEERLKRKAHKKAQKEMGKKKERAKDANLREKTKENATITLRLLGVAKLAFLKSLLLCNRFKDKRSPIEKNSATEDPANLKTALKLIGETHTIGLR